MNQARFRYFLRSFNLLNVVLAAAVVLLLGYTIFPMMTTDIRISLSAAKEKAAVRTEKPAPVTAAAPADYLVIADLNPFHPERRVPPEKKDEKSVAKPEIVLYGTLITDGVRTAYVEDRKSPYSTPGRGKRQRTLKKGDVIGGYVLKAIEDKRIILVKGDDVMIVGMDGDKKRAPETAATSPAAASTGAAPPAAVAPVSGPVPASKLAQPQPQVQYPTVRKSRRPMAPQ